MFPSRQLLLLLLEKQRDLHERVLRALQCKGPPAPPQLSQTTCAVDIGPKLSLITFRWSESAIRTRPTPTEEEVGHPSEVVKVTKQRMQVSWLTGGGSAQESLHQS